MHYCNWNFADYASHTGHLSPLEDIAYRRMLDHYYLHEKPLPREVKNIAREIRMREHEAEICAVLGEFFVRSRDGYRNKRADEEIANYRKRVEQASNAGRASAQRRLNGRSTTVDVPLNGAATSVQPTKNQEPRTSTTPTPPFGGAGPGAGCSATEEESDPVVELKDALARTDLRNGMAAFDRTRALMALAEKVGPSGITPDHVGELWPLAQQHAKQREDGDPGALLNHWLEEGIWREVLDERDAKDRAKSARSRVATDADPLEGVYGA